MLPPPCRRAASKFPLRTSTPAGPQDSMFRLVSSLMLCTGKMPARSRRVEAHPREHHLATTFKTHFGTCPEPPDTGTRFEAYPELPPQNCSEPAPQIAPARNLPNSNLSGGTGPPQLVRNPCYKPGPNRPKSSCCWGITNRIGIIALRCVNKKYRRQLEPKSI